MTENFQSIPWLNGNATEVRTGFEPLFFHIQAEFQWQRPFSEGCRGEIPEKTKKNLSQSYGRWIVGFHEPMTSVLPPCFPYLFLAFTPISYNNICKDHYRLYL